MRSILKVSDHMKFIDTKAIHLFSILFRLIAAFLVGGVAAHVIVMLLDYFLLTKPVYLNLRENFVKSIFSGAMLPMMVAYGLFSILTYSLWAKMKKALLLAHAEEIKSEKVEGVLKSMQRITGLLAEHIAMHNKEILRWIELRKIRGKPVSEKLEKPSQSIAGVLQSLSKIAFVYPYSKNRPGNVAEIEKILHDKLLETSGSKTVKTTNNRHRRLVVSNAKSSFR